MVSDDDWVNLALNDASVVADMLARLRDAPLPPPPPKRKSSSPPLQLEWTVRQRRSRPAARSLAESSYTNKTKKTELARGSPTTPLSWSGTTSHSGAADGFEESSCLAGPLDPARSKALAATSQTTTIGNKRSRKKKTLAELKDEESLLLKERRSLKHELATLRARLENERAKNESFKRLKVDLQPQQTLKTVMSSMASEETISDQLQHVEADSVRTPSSSAANMRSLCLDTVPHPLLLTCSSKVETESQDTGFLLPDLNVPLDDDSGSKALHDMS